MNFLICANQLLLEGFTRQLPLVSLVNGKWFVGKIDELRMPIVGTAQNPSLVDTKTRSQATLPSEPQQRSSREEQIQAAKQLVNEVLCEYHLVEVIYDIKYF